MISPARQRSWIWREPPRWSAKMDADLVRPADRRIIGQRIAARQARRQLHVDMGAGSKGISPPPSGSSVKDRISSASQRMALIRACITLSLWRDACLAGDLAMDRRGIAGQIASRHLITCCLWSRHGSQRLRLFIPLPRPCRASGPPGERHLIGLLQRIIRIVQERSSTRTVKDRGVFHARRHGPLVASARAASSTRRRTRAIIWSVGARFSKLWSVIGPMLSDRPDPAW
jgi:hypothetical protein